MPHTPVEESLFSIIRCYHRYAAREGDVETLSLEELKALLMDNVPCFMESLNLLDLATTVFSLPAQPRIHRLLGNGQRTLVSGRKDPYYIAELFRAADKNKDNQICFNEFLFILGKLVKDYHLQYHRQLCACYSDQHSLY